MNHDEILKAIEKNGGQVTISQTLNLLTCVNFTLKSGKQNAYKLKWKKPVITKITRFFKELFNIKIDEEPYLTWDGVRPIFAYVAFDDVEDFLAHYAPKYSIDEDLNVHLKPYIVIEHSKDITNIFFNTLDEANEVYRLMQEAFADMKLPTIIKEDFEEKKIRVSPDKSEKIID